MGAWALRRSRNAPVLLLALPLLGVARLLPADGVGLWLRLHRGLGLRLPRLGLRLRALRQRLAGRRVDGGSLGEDDHALRR